MADTETRSEFVQEPTRAGRDRGFSLVEVVVTLTLMAVVLVPIMSAVVMSIRSSSQGRSAAQVETVLVNAADQVNRADPRCDYTSVVKSSVSLQGWNPDRGAVSHEFYEPGANPSEPGSWIPVAPCDINVLLEGRVQRVTISVTSPDGAIHREIQVVKSDV